MRRITSKQFTYVSVSSDEIGYVYEERYVDSDQLVDGTKMHKLHHRWVNRLKDAAGDRDRLKQMKHQMLKEFVYFDRVTCLDVPDLIRAKIWQCL